jgi:hypothetical protein
LKRLWTASSIIPLAFDRLMPAPQTGLQAMTSRSNASMMKAMRITSPFQPGELKAVRTPSQVGAPDNDLADADAAFAQPYVALEKKRCLLLRTRLRLRTANSLRVSSRFTTPGDTAIAIDGPLVDGTANEGQQGCILGLETNCMADLSDRTRPIASTIVPLQ